jgi:hypothetical protein
MTIGMVRSAQASPESMASSPVDSSPTTKGRSSRRGLLIDAHTPSAGRPDRLRRSNSGRADLNAANLLQPVDRVCERLRRVPLRDAEVAFGWSVI